MDCRKFELTLISAYGLENVRKICKMKVHARVSFGSGSGSGPETEKWSPTDTHGEMNPAWNYTMKYTIGESMIEHFNNMLVIKLYCKRKLGDRYVGEVNTSMKELFECSRATGGSSPILTFPIHRGCVPSQGELKLSYRFGEKVMIDKLLLAESVPSWSRLC